MSQQRLPYLKPAELEGKQKETHDEILESTNELMHGKGFIYQNSSDGALVGPFCPFVYLPKEVGLHFNKLCGALGNVGLPPAARETTILVTGSQYRAAYELYAHKNLAIHTGALSKEQAEAACKGEKPEGGDEISVAYDVTMALVKKSGPLDKGLWEKAVKTFGLKNTLALVQYIGLYAYTSVLLNAIDAPVPE